MIITRELVAETTCQEFIDWVNAHPQYYGLKRKQFNKAIRDEINAGQSAQPWWADWLDENYFKGDAIAKSGKVKRLGIYRTMAPGLDAQEFDNIDDAVAILETAKNAQLEAEALYFHIQVRQRHGASGYDILSVCDTTQDTCVAPTASAYFSTFNINTGAYEDFLTYGQAKNRMIELRNARRDLVANSFMIEEKVQEIGDADAAPADFVIVETITGKKTHYKDRLDRVERRPDRKPKKPKP